MIANKETLQGKPLRGQTTITEVQVGRIERDKILSWLSLAIPLVVSAILNLWNLGQNGYSNLYYSVAVQSMIQSFHNFFFASYDAGGFISVDKPPVALWIQAISARIFGFSPLSILMPEALAGVASVGLVYLLVKRVFGTFAASIAALAMALTPIAVAVERTNNTDTWLMFFLLLAAWAISIATEKGKLGLLLLSMALVGVAFNTKMLAAFIVLPAFYLLYFIAAPIKWPKRIGHLVLASLVVFGVALSWPLAVDLTPADQRPWVGGSQNDSVLNLALGYNGLGRVTGNEGRGGPGGGRGGFQPPAQSGQQNGFPFNLFPSLGGNNPGTNQPQFNGGGPGGFGGRGFGGPGGPGGGGMFGAGLPGATRLFTGEMAGQWSWLFPLAMFGVLATALTVKRKWPLDRRLQAVILWGGWLATYGVVFSIASGIFHPYYLVMLAPAAAALVGSGVGSMWRLYKSGGWQAWLLPAALFATAIWQITVLGNYAQWTLWLTPLLFAGSLLAVFGLIGARLMSAQVWRRWSPGLVGLSVVALLLTPVAWSVTPVMAGPSNASLPVAGPEALNQNDPTSWTRLQSESTNPLITYLEDNQDGYLYLLAVSNSQQASSIALETGKPVLAAAGFMGTDPALTAGKLAEMVSNHEVRFVMGLGGGVGGFGRGGGGGNSSVNGWIQANCSAVDPSAYGGGSAVGFTGAFGMGNSQLYDCAAR